MFVGKLFTDLQKNNGLKKNDVSLWKKENKVLTSKKRKSKISQTYTLPHDMGVINELDQLPQHDYLILIISQ